jgi:hypothetical protein
MPHDTTRPSIGTVGVRLQRDEDSYPPADTERKYSPSLAVGSAPPHEGRANTRDRSTVVRMDILVVQRTRGQRPTSDARGDAMAALPLHDLASIPRSRLAA